jgi:hypothetical protein
MRDNVLIAILIIFAFFLALLVFYVGLMQVTKWVNSPLPVYAVPQLTLCNRLAMRMRSPSEVSLNLILTTVSSARIRGQRVMLLVRPLELLW